MAFAPLPVSKKFYDDIVDRILEATAAVIRDFYVYKNLMNIFKAYLEGVPPERSSDNVIAIALFEMVRRDVDKALARSRQARQRAAERKAKQRKGASANRKQERIAVTEPELTALEVRELRLIMRELRMRRFSFQKIPESAMA